LDLGKADDGLFFQIRWEGFPDKKDYTWIEIQTMYEEMPKVVTDFLASCNKRKLVRQARKQLQIHPDEVKNLARRSDPKVT